MVIVLWELFTIAIFMSVSRVIDETMIMLMAVGINSILIPQIVLFSDQTPAVHFVGPLKPEHYLQFAGGFFSAGTADSTSYHSLHQCDELCKPVIHRAGSLESREYQHMKSGHLRH